MNSPFTLQGFLSKLALTLGLVVAMAIPTWGQSFVLDKTAVPPEFFEYFDEVEQDLNARIQGYSGDMPTALLYQLNRITIICRVVPAPAGILGFAGPTATVSIQTGDLFRSKSLVVPVTGQITINLNEIDFMIAEDNLVSTIAHEILHAFGLGSLWTQNGLIGPVNGIGATQYIGGRYAIQQYRNEVGNPFAVFVPVQQTGGAGSAFSHWCDSCEFFNQTFTPAFKKELMTAFACDLRPDTLDELVCPPNFFSMTSEGALADLGYAMFKINPNRGPVPTGGAGRNWPKIVGDRRDPFAGMGAGADAGNLSFKLVNIVKVYKRSKNVGDGVDLAEPTIRANDPFNLRNHSWAK